MSCNEKVYRHRVCNIINMREWKGRCRESFYNGNYCRDEQSSYRKANKSCTIELFKGNTNDNLFRNVAKYFEVPLCRFVCFLTTNTQNLSPFPLLSFLNTAVSFLFIFIAYRNNTRHVCLHSNESSESIKRTRRYTCFCLPLCLH